MWTAMINTPVKHTPATHTPVSQGLFMKHVSCAEGRDVIVLELRDRATAVPDISGVKPGKSWLRGSINVYYVKLRRAFSSP